MSGVKSVGMLQLAGTAAHTLQRTPDSLFRCFGWRWRCLLRAP